MVVALSRSESDANGDAERRRASINRSNQANCTLERDKERARECNEQNKRKLNQECCKTKPRLASITSAKWVHRKGRSKNCNLLDELGCNGLDRVLKRVIFLRPKHSICIISSLIKFTSGSCPYTKATKIFKNL